MAPQANKAYNSFIKGIITEASPLTYPEDAVDTNNIVSVTTKSAGAYNVADLDNTAVDVYRWDDNGVSGAKSYMVVRIGEWIYVYDATVSPLSWGLVFSVDMAAYRSPKYASTSIANTRVDFASGRGKLFVVGEGLNPFYLTVIQNYTYTTLPIPFTVSPTFTSNTSLTGTDTAIVPVPISMQIRDMTGIAEGTSPSYQPATLTNEHHYNLLNQGWTDALINQYKTDTGVYPSNSQQWFVGKDVNDNFSSSQLQKTDFGNTYAPRGRFLFDAFNLDYASIAVDFQQPIRPDR